MAILQVRDIDDDLYHAIKRQADKERRSISQEVITILETYFREGHHQTAKARIDEFTNLEWVGDETPEELTHQVKTARSVNKRFGKKNDLFA